MIKLDQATELLSKGRFARVAVKVDISQALAPGVNIEINEIPSFWQQFEYEHIHLFCRQCGRAGHRSPSYNLPSNKLTSAVVATPFGSNQANVEMATVESVDPKASDEAGILPLPWIHVRRRRRNPKAAEAILDNAQKSSPVDFSKTPQLNARASTRVLPTSFFSGQGQRTNGPRGPLRNPKINSGSMGGGLSPCTVSSAHSDVGLDEELQPHVAQASVRQKAEIGREDLISEAIDHQSPPCESSDFPC